MTQLTLPLDLHETEPRTWGLSWRRWTLTGFPMFDLLSDGEATGWHVGHCGHQTANMPYYIDSPTEPIITGRAYQTLKQAQEVCIREYEAAQ